MATKPTNHKQTTHRPIIFDIKYFRFKKQALTGFERSTLAVYWYLSHPVVKFEFSRNCACLVAAELNAAEMIQ